MSPPLVSVLMACYRHERFIRQAIESVLLQRTPFPVELIVGDDASPDASAAIISGLAAAHPGRIRALLHPRNLGSQANTQCLFAAATGRYIALLEGDDYWTDPAKLSRQIAALEAAPSIPGSIHAAQVVDVTGAPLGETPPAAARSAFVTFAALAAENTVPTASLVFRRHLLPCPPGWASGLVMHDWPCLLELSALGPLKRFPQLWSAYRAHPGGIWSGATHLSRLRALVDLFDRAEKRFPLIAGTRMPANRKKLLFELFQRADAADDVSAARHWLRRYWCALPGRWQLPPHQGRAVLRTVFGWPARRPAP